MFEEDFENGIPTNWAFNTVSGPPGTTWEYTTLPSQGEFNSGRPAIASTTGANGFLIMDADKHNTPLNPSYQTMEATVTTTPVNLLSFANPKLGFQHYFRYSTGAELLVGVSNDGLNFTEWDVKGAVGVGADSDNPVTELIDISAVAGNQSTVYIRFRWKGSTHFFWMVDDIRIFVPSTNQDVSGLIAGTYTVIVTQANGCIITDSVTIVDLAAPIVVDSSTVTGISCYGNNSDGIIALDIVSGGAPPYSYLWNNADTVQNPTGLTAGIYSVTVSDTSNCTGSKTFIVTGDTVAALSISGTPPTCGLGSDGSAVSALTWGNPPFSYLWENGQTDSMATGLTAGTWSLTVTDNNGCIREDSVTIIDPPVFSASIAGTNVSCNGGTNGFADLTIVNGTAPFTYAWSNGMITQDVSGLIATTYVVNISDVNGCTASALVNISEPTPLISVISGSNLTCNGANDGSIDLTVFGGTQPYTYLWSTGDTIQDLTGLSGGSYNVFITDANNCTAVDVVVIDEPAAINLNVFVTDATCAGGSDGSVNLSVTGGVSPYFYLWSNGQSTEDITGLTSGLYGLTVTDNNGCTAGDTISVNEPATVLAASITGAGVSCNGLCDGTATVSATGGSPPYVYLWSDPSNQTDSTAVGLCPGSYNVNVSDANNCQATPVVAISEPDALSLTVSASDASCGNADGSAAATPVAGTTPYSYSWSNAASTSGINGISTGTYIVTVTDANGCTVADSAVIGITAPPQPVCLITVDTTATKNIVVWEKAMVSNIAAYKIYREIASVFTFIGSVPYDSLSYFIDNTNGVNPQITSYRYKVSAVDDCGNESALSDFHKTMHLQISQGVPPALNLSWDDYIGFSFTFYRILMDSAGTGNWQTIDSISFGINSWTDPTPPQTSSLRYLVEVVSPSVCTASKAKNFNSSKSNSTAVSGSAETCSDGIQNQDETGVDCGGVCAPCAQAGPLALFTASTTSIDAGDSINFIDLSTNNPDTWSWFFSGGVPFSSTVKSPGNIAYDIPGCYEVTLISSNSFGTDSEIKTCYIVVNPATGIGQAISNLESLTIYPNPNTGTFTLEFTAAVEQEIQIRIFNVLGQNVASVFNQSVKAKANNRIEIDMSNHPVGVYNLQLLSNDGTINKKVIIGK